MAIKTKRSVSGVGVITVVPTSLNIPDRPVDFIFNLTTHTFSWKSDTNTNTTARAGSFEVYKSTTGYNWTYSYYASVTNDRSSASLSYTDDIGVQGDWYKIRGVNGKDLGLFSHSEEIRDDDEIVRVIGILKNQDGTRITNAQVSAKMVITGEAEQLDGWQTLLAYKEVSVVPNSINGFFELLLLRLSSGTTKYTFKISCDSFVVTTDLDLLATYKEQWLLVDLSVSTLVLKLEGRVN